MNNSNFVDKLKEKVKETNYYLDDNTTMQKKLLKSSRDFNFKIRNYLEGDINEKNIHADSQEKLNKIRNRIDNCKTNLSNIKEKIKNKLSKYVQ